jgi:phage terminase large subunit
MRNSELVLDAPNPKQKEFLLARSRYIAYGGARGGGKSWALRIKAIMMCLRYAGFKALFLRRTLPELRENHIVEMRGMLRDIAAYRETDRAFNFPNGSRLRFGYCDYEKDVEQYQGQEYDCIFIDEATQFSEYQFSVLSASVRGTNDFPKRMYLSCNPGGVGHGWVKRLFIDKDYKDTENPKDYTFIKALVYDNKPLMESNPQYLKVLEALPERIRKAWLEGDWDVYEGQYFGEFDRDIHVLDPPFNVEGNIYVAMDYGLDMLACYWIVVDLEGNALVYKELYESGLIISRAAERILEVNAGDKPILWIAPPDMYNRNRDTGESAAEIFLRHGIPLYKADNDRVMGWYALKEWLKVYEKDGKATARLKIGSNCVNLIRCLPQLQCSERNPNDTANEPHEITHAPDALRYFVSARPLTPQIEPEEENILTIDNQINEFIEFGR